MKEVIKASVAGYSFTFEKEAHDFLENYLNELENHFSTKEDGREIVDGIEDRISELLRIDKGNTESVITIDEVKHLVGIMGKPSDMDDESATPDSDNQHTTKAEAPFYKKRIYRDESNCLLGGVLSGLANYLDIDKVWLRVGFILAVILGGKYVHSLGAFLVLSYIVMWVVVPKAKTIGEKLAMSGKNPSISDIEAGNRHTLISTKNRPRRSASKGFRIVISVILLLVSLSLLSVFVFGHFFSSLWDMPSLADFVEISGFHSSDIMWLVWIIGLLPIAAMVYFAVRLLSGFKKSDVAVLGFGFVIWLGLCAYMGIIGIDFARNYRKKGVAHTSIAVTSKSDTIYVDLSDKYKAAVDPAWFEGDDEVGNLRQINENTKAWFIVPQINVENDSTLKTVEVRIKKRAFAPSRMLADTKAENAVFDVQVQDSLVLLNPHIYSKANHWDRELFEMTIAAPTGKKVVLKNSLKDRNYHDSDND